MTTPNRLVEFEALTVAQQQQIVNPAEHHLRKLEIQYKVSSSFSGDWERRLTLAFAAIWRPCESRA